LSHLGERIDAVSVEKDFPNSAVSEPADSRRPTPVSVREVDHLGLAPIGEALSGH
jgi:hypothetical protein